METKNTIKKKSLITACLIAIICTFFISCSVKPGTEAKIIFFIGDAEITHIEGKTEPAVLKMLLKKGDIIKTKSGYLLLQIGDNILTRIQSNTIVEISKLFEDSETNLSLDNGQLISHVKKLSKDTSFKIKTPTAVAAVRGTQYSVSYYKNRSVLAVKEGKVQVDTKEKDVDKQIMVETGNTLVINRGKNRSINDFELLEIDKISQIPYSSKSELEGEDVYKNIAKTTEDQELNINKQILAKGGPIPKTLDEMLNKFGYLNRLTLYSNKYYTGVIISRGKTDVKIMTLDGIESVPSKQVKNTKRTMSTVE
jgi:hypothetical protein